MLSFLEIADTLGMSISKGSDGVLRGAANRVLPVTRSVDGGRAVPFRATILCSKCSPEAIDILVFVCGDLHVWFKFQNKGPVVLSILAIPETDAGVGPLNPATPETVFATLPRYARYTYHSTNSRPPFRWDLFEG